MSSGLYQIRDKNLDTTLDLTRLKPYGDTMNDGKVQTSFTLPVKDDDKGAAAAVMLAQKMGLADPNVALRQKLDENFTFYVVYGSLTHSINYNEIVVQTVTDETMDMHENDEFLKERLGRKMVVIGASTGTDAHTVGIDAIMNRKGFAGHYGLERYDMIEAYNLGSQVPNEEFLRKAAEVNADVLLVSQTVTQKDVHIQNLTELIELAEAEGVRDKYIFCCGGARITHALAKELGYDAGFGAGTYADDVATFCSKELSSLSSFSQAHSRRNFTVPAAVPIELISIGTGTFQNEFILKSGLIQRERPRPVSLGLRPIHLQGTLTVHLRTKRRRKAALALRIALRGSLSHDPSLPNHSHGNGAPPKLPEPCGSGGCLLFSLFVAHL